MERKRRDFQEETWDAFVRRDEPPMFFLMYKTWNTTQYSQITNHLIHIGLDKHIQDAVGLDVCTTD